MFLLPLYTEGQKEIAERISLYHCKGYEINKIFAEVEFSLQPSIERLVIELSKDKKFMKSLKVLCQGKKKNDKRGS